jgi:hypothetical protein
MSLMVAAAQQQPGSGGGHMSGAVAGSSMAASRVRAVGGTPSSWGLQALGMDTAGDTCSRQRVASATCLL